jgi:Tfp pilus assembly major pilin PilA
MRKQRGVSLIGLIIVASIAAFVAIIGFKLLPTYIEYFTIKRMVSDLAHSPELRGTSVKDVKLAFDRRAQIDNINSIRADDLEITKEGDGFSIVAAYSVKVPLFGNVSACMDFEARN